MTVTLADFEGAWVLERRIVHEDALDAQFRGSARFRPEGGGLLYEEKGILKVAGQRPVSAQQRYFWREGQGGVIEVLFDDGHAFHMIDPARPQDTHWCDPDSYEVSYEFGHWPDWIAVWNVRGPRKAYRMVSTYRRPVAGD